MDWIWVLKDLKGKCGEGNFVGEVEKSQAWVKYSWSTLGKIESEKNWGHEVKICRESFKTGESEKARIPS